GAIRRSPPGSAARGLSRASPLSVWQRVPVQHSFGLTLVDDASSARAGTEICSPPCGRPHLDHNERLMDLNSPLFDRIRVKPEQREEPREDRVRCNFPGCEETGEFRAPMGRLREGQYFCFCLDHVRQYNASYNYFNGM